MCAYETRSFCASRNRAECHYSRRRSPSRAPASDDSLQASPCSLSPGHDDDDVTGKSFWPAEPGSASTPSECRELAAVASSGAGGGGAVQGLVLPLKRFEPNFFLIARRTSTTASATACIPNRTSLGSSPTYSTFKRKCDPDSFAPWCPGCTAVAPRLCTLNAMASVEFRSLFGTMRRCHRAFVAFRRSQAFPSPRLPDANRTVNAAPAPLRLVDSMIETPVTCLFRGRFSASPATGLIGLEENEFLGDFFECLGFLALANQR